MQTCSFCSKSVHNLKAKGLCAACYQRQNKHGSPDRVKVRKPCSVEGCENLSVAQDLCEKHYRRMKRTGEIEGERFDRWGHKESHPLYDTYNWIIRHRHEMCQRWRDNFWDFVSDVGEKPTSAYKLRRIRRSEPYSPENFQWVDLSSCVPTKTLKERSEWMRTYRINNPDKFRDISLRQRFGITLDQYIEMHESQGGVCDICKNPETAMIKKTGVPQNLAVDHCHGSGKIRGLLCSNCNSMLGDAKDSIPTLEAAIAYLKKHHP